LNLLGSCQTSDFHYLVDAIVYHLHQQRVTLSLDYSSLGGLTIALSSLDRLVASRFGPVSMAARVQVGFKKAIWLLHCVDRYKDPRRKSDLLLPA
jgi:hypothetical protein